MNNPIRLGHIDLSFHQASAAVVQAILEAHGHEGVVSAYPHEEMFKRFGNDEFDLLVSAWLPDSHGAYLAPIIETTRKLSLQTLKTLAHLHLGNEVVTRIDHAIRKHGVDALSIAREWLASDG